MKLDVSLSYVIKRLALLSLLILITSSLYADFTLIYFAAVAAESLITAFAHKHNKKTVLTPFIFNAVYLILFFYFMSEGAPYQGMFLLEGTEPFIDFVRYNMTDLNSTGLIMNLAAFLLPAVGLTMLDMQIQKAMYTEEACKISRDEIHRRKVTFYAVQLLLLFYSFIFEPLFSVTLFAAFVYCLVNIIYFLSADSSVKLLRKSDYPDNRICKSLIVTADIKSFAYMPQLLPSAFLTGCPKLRKVLRHNRITEQNGCIVLKYGRYLDHKYNADKITKKSLLVYCSTLKMFKDNFSKQLSDIFDEYISKEFKVYLLVTEKCPVKCKKQYDKLKEILGNKVIFLDARDMEQGESLEQYLGVSTTVRPSAPHLIETEHSRNEENYNTQISIYRRRSKSDIKNIKRYYITPFLLGASPLAILVIQKLLSSLAERKNSPCYTAVKRFYEKDRLVILLTMCFINIIIVLTLFGAMDVLPVFYLLCINPILYIAAVALYIRIYVEILRSGDMGQIHQKRLLINGDMGDLLNCSCSFPNHIRMKLLSLKCKTAVWTTMQNTTLLSSAMKGLFSMKSSLTL